MHLENIIWQQKLAEMPRPPFVLALLDLFFILLVIFMMSSNFVFLPGVKSVPLPTLKDAEISEANKLVVTVSRRTQSDPAMPAQFTYSFNGQPSDSWEELHGTLTKRIATLEKCVANSTPAEDRPALLIVLRAEKTVPYEELIKFYDFARNIGPNVHLFLATDMETADDSTLGND